ncbi:MAG: hypothetical protein LBQ24_02585 [Candidatus Peribacteria bacterium]|nr:hypothetical protein [Candidatus Peribacteria bacterium]
MQPENEVLEFINQANLDDSQKERVRIIWRQRQIDNKPRTLDILREVIKKLKLNQI